MLLLPPEDFTMVARKVAEALKPKGYLLLILNEGVSSFGEVQEVHGEQMYSTGVSEQEVRNSFEPPLGLVNLDRETVTTEEYGTENTMMFLFQKPQLARQINSKSYRVAAALRVAPDHGATADVVSVDLVRPARRVGNVGEIA